MKTGMLLFLLFAWAHIHGAESEVTQRRITTKERPAKPSQEPKTSNQDYSAGGHLSEQDVLIGCGTCCMTCCALAGIWFFRKTTHS